MLNRLTHEDDLFDAACQDPELAPFAYFELDLGAAVNPPTAGGDGTPMFPELGGEHTPLWTLTSNVGGAGREAARQTRQAERVEKMRQRVEAGLSPLDEGEEHPCPKGWDKIEGDDTPQDEWATFWGAGGSPTERGFVSRARIPQ